MTPTICLVMIVRDESAVIERALRSVRPLVSQWRIIDTGSTDDTADRIRAALQGIPGELRSSEWVDFATNRTEVITWARGSADWLLLLDADMTVEIESTFANTLAAFTGDAALLSVTGDLDYRMPYLVRGNRPWHYVGRTHEHLSSSEPFSAERFDDLRIVHHADGGTRGEKFERDLRLLSAAVVENPNDPRSLFYLAQTRRDMGDDAAALTLYRRRVEVGGWDEETFYSLYQAGLTEDRLGRPESTDTLQVAWDSRPTRAEPLYHLARINRLRRRHHLSWIFASLAIAIPRPEDLLFVEGWVYLWGAQFELADAAWRIGEHARAVELARALLGNDGLPEDHRVHLNYILELLGAE